MEMQVVCRAAGRPKKDGNPQVELRTVEVPDANSLIAMGFSTYMDYLESQDDWKGKVVSVVDDLIPPTPSPAPAPLGEFPDGARVEVAGMVRPPSLASPQFDPFTKFKTEPEKFYYRGLNVNPKKLQKRKFEGYEIVSSEATYGDLVLGKLPLAMKEAKDRAKLQKTRDQQKAVNEGFHEAAERAGVKSFEG
jgi:hypothetical protein